MARLVKNENLAQERLAYIKKIILAIRELKNCSSIDIHTKDVIAFIYLNLLEISKTVEKTISAWEKRGYWIKADRFQLEWKWVDVIGNKLLHSLVSENWSEVAMTISETGDKLKIFNVNLKKDINETWSGSWEKFITISQNKVKNLSS